MNQTILVVSGTTVPAELHQKYQKVAVFVQPDFLEREFEEMWSVRVVLVYGDVGHHRTRIDAWARDDARRHHLQTAEGPLMLEALIQQYANFRPESALRMIQYPRGLKKQRH